MATVVQASNSLYNHYKQAWSSNSDQVLTLSLFYTGDVSHSVVDDIRVFYDVNEDTVEVLAIVLKSEAIERLERYGESDKESSSDSTEG